MIRMSSALLCLLPVALLSSCTLETFDMEACDLDDSIGFKIFPINGWHREYDPRPSDLFVQVADGQPYDQAVVWATRLRYDDFGKRTPRKLIAYGERLLGWEVQQPPKPLSKGIRYRVHVSDGGHNGNAEFEIGKALPVC